MEECPECGSTELQHNGSDVYWCDNCGWEEQDDIDEMNEEED